MKYKRFDARHLSGLSFLFFVLWMVPSAFAQGPPPGEVPSEGISSYIFSPMTITVLLVLALVAQIVYRQRSRKVSVESATKYTPQAAPHAAAPSAKRRFDKEELSKLLKASASTKKGSRTLEEAIRLSKVLEPQIGSQATPGTPAEKQAFDVEALEPHAVEEHAVDGQAFEYQAVETLAIENHAEEPHALEEQISEENVVVVDAATHHEPSVEPVTKANRGEAVNESELHSVDA